MASPNEHLKICIIIRFFTIRSRLFSLVNPIILPLPDNEDMIGAVVEAFGPTTKIGVSQPDTLATGFVESIYVRPKLRPLLPD